MGIGYEVHHLMQSLLISKIKTKLGQISTLVTVVATHNSVVLVIDWGLEEPFTSWYYHVVEILVNTSPLGVKLIKMELDLRSWDPIEVLEDGSFY